MGLNLEYINGQTPIDEDEKEGLLIDIISTHGELDEFEQQNIEEAMQWAFRKKFKAEVVFTEEFIRMVHKKMYGNVWVWAGEFRKTDKNLGVSKFDIPVELKILCDDTIYWIEQETYSPDEIAIRFKHRIVSIHCFPNGNGRHSRFMGDIIIEKILGKQLFSWGAKNLSQSGDNRTNYLNAIKAADNGDYAPLLAFARS
jgi:Fic-DOC domain mobile mystery protein B